MGKKYVREFSILNRSELATKFETNFKKTKKADIEISDYESGNQLQDHGNISSFSHLRISITLIPKSVGEIEFPVYVYNKSDENNVMLFKIRAMILSNIRAGMMVYNEQGALITGLNFGECFSGSRSSQNMIIKNTSENNIDISFKSENSDITFEVQTELEEQSLKEGENEKKIEDINISPGSSVKIAVVYVPEKSRENETNLKKREFSIVLQSQDQLSKETYSRKIPCTGYVCTSIIEVNPKEINFGDCNIGLVKTSSITIYNKSELPCQVNLVVTSHVISCSAKEIKIAPKQSYEVKINYSPRKINPNYKKSIVFKNLQNTKNENSVLIKSNNNDGNMLTYHSEFYEVITNSQHNYSKTLNYYNIVLNDISLNSFLLKAKKDVNLRFSSSVDEIKIFKKGTPNLNISDLKLKEKFLTTVEEKVFKLEKRKEIQDLLLKKTDEKVESIEKKSPISEDAIIDKFLENLIKTYENPIQFLTKDGTDTNIEEMYAKSIFNLRKCMEFALNEKILIPIDDISLQEGIEERLYVVFHPSKNRTNITQILQKIEEKIYIQINNQKEKDSKEVPPRILTIQAKICVSIMNIAQKNINFGEILNTEEKKKKIILTNISEVPLIFKLSKTGSISSGDIKLEEKNNERILGVIRPFGKREVKIEFKPTLSGKFQETLTFLNARDKNNSIIVNLKATIKQPEKFTIKEYDTNFGILMIDKKSITKKISIQNVTKNKITFVMEEISNSFNGINFQYFFEKETMKLPSVHFEKLENELEAHEHKLRIAIRKNKLEKTKELEDRIKEIKKILNMNPKDENPSEDENPSDDEKSPGSLKTTKKGTLFSVPPNSIVTIFISFIPQSNSVYVNESGTITFSVYEKKNVDLKKLIVFSANIKKFGVRTPSEPKKSSFMNLTPIITKIQENFIISPKIQDFGVVKIGQELKGMFMITNLGQKSGFVILNPKSQNLSFTFSKQNSDLDTNESSEIYFTCSPQSIGIQKHVVTIQDLSTKLEYEYMIRVDVQTSSPIEILQLSKESNEIDFGYSFYNKKKEYYNIIPLSIQSNLDNSLLVSVNSNFSTQVYIFQDEQLSNPAVNVEFNSREKKILYVALKPYLLQHDIESGNCRLLVGGLKFHVKDKELNKVIHERVVKFKSIVGNSILVAKPSLIDLGSTVRFGKSSKGSFHLENKNPLMPLKYNINSPSNNINIHTLEGEIEPGKTKEIKFTLKTEEYGLNEVEISVENLMSSEIIKAKVRMFVDDKSINTDLPKNEIGIDEMIFSNVYVPSDFKTSLPFSKSLKIKNMKDKTYILTPSSELIYLESKGESITSFEIKPNEELELDVCVDSCKLIWDEYKIKKLQSGKQTLVKGYLQLIENNSIIKVISIHLHLCVSEGRLSSDSQEKKLGKFGYINNWEDISIEGIIENTSDFPLFLTAYSDDIKILEQKIVIEPQGSTKWIGIFPCKDYKDKTEDENILKKVDFINKYNPCNQFTLNIYAQLTTCAWKFQRLEQNQLILPILNFPSENPIDNSFHIINQSEDIIDTKLEVVLNPILEDIIILDVLDHNSGLSINSYKFLPKSLLDVRVKCKRRPKSLIPKEIFDSVLTTEKISGINTFPKILFGTIKISGRDQPTEDIEIVGGIFQSLTFSLSTTKLFFQSKKNEKKEIDESTLVDTFTIQNLSNSIPLNFIVEPFNSEIQKNIRIIPEQGVIDANSSYTISVFLHKDSIKDESDLKFIVKDLLSPLSSQTLTSKISKTLKEEIKLIERNSPIFSVTPRNEFIENRLIIKGCQVIGESPFERYIIDMGQQNYLSTEKVEWDLTIETTSQKPIQYKLFPIGGKENSWITFSQTEGVLEGKHDSHVIKLNFSTKELNNYSTYLVLQNMNNFGDMKIIRLNMEVVSSGLDSKNYFNVLVDEGPIENNSVIELGEVFLGEMIRHHYLDIQNLMNIALDFHFTSNNSEDDTELHFSLSLTSLKSFHSLRVEPKSSIRIYLLYSPKNPKITEEVVEIFIKCRILKDYQERVLLKSKIVHPVMSVKQTEVLFVSSEKKIQDIVIIENKNKNSLNYSIRTNCIFFDIRTPYGFITSENSHNTFQILPMDSHSITIKPKVEQILEKIKGPYIEEHFTIYNKNNKSEKIWITMKFTRGFLRQFYPTPGPKTGYVFTFLEEQIIQFLTRFSQYCDNLTSELKKSEDKLKTIEYYFTRESVKQLHFDLHYITDELVFYGLKGRVGSSFYDLAKLLYGVIYSHQIFDLFKDTSIVKKWFGQLEYFLSYFPMKKNDTTIKELIEKFK